MSPTRRTRRTPRARRRRTLTVAALALALTAAAARPALAEPGPTPAPTTLPEVRAELQRLYREAAVATDRFNAADEKVTRQEKRVATLRDQVGEAERRLARLTGRAGAAARAQYRSGTAASLPVEVQFVLAEDPERALDDATLARQAQQGTLGLVTALTATGEELRARGGEAAEVLERLRTDREDRDTEREKVEERIAAAEELEAGLAADQLRTLDDLDTRDADTAQDAWLDTGVLDTAGTTTTAAGKEAVEYAARQLGKPYIWGAEGPGGYDCSGLTSQAWLSAGVTIPRTSQAQWQGLTRIPVGSMRPGDLIVYYPDASHVALYIGDGRMINAPRPGRTVSIAPAGSMPILGVVRPGA
ncbi:NlpC/P60 family protein [Streptomyces sp. NPDC093252]|uniref:C40 family peptidase n=1 Tax=Streptomyces sp. NPDC093252 TaxID=3154980 RepID=UPI003428CE34